MVPRLTGWFPTSTFGAPAASSSGSTAPSPRFEAAVCRTYFEKPEVVQSCHPKLRPMSARRYPMKHKTLLGAAAVTVGLSGSHAIARERWYISHLYAEPCVPLDDIGFDYGRPIRLYYATGPMKTPADAVAALVAMGARLRKLPGPYPGRAGRAADREAGAWR
jgi:hypothetical protein